MAVKNFYTATDVNPGDIFVCAVTLHVNDFGYRVYRCAYGSQNEHEGVPQGTRILQEKAVAEALFPIIRDLGLGVDDV